jgi:DNA-binding HxlR family transcriptional regulator
MSKQEEDGCSPQDLMAVKDALEALRGSWKLQILIVLFDGPRRFKEIAKGIKGISDKMLSKELKDLEENALVTRTVHDTFPPKVEYQVTDHAKTLGDVIRALKHWGRLHRKVIIGTGQ